MELIATCDESERQEYIERLRESVAFTAVSLASYGIEKDDAYKTRRARYWLKRGAAHTALLQSISEFYNTKKTAPDQES